jgi:hypothetical protein
MPCWLMAGVYPDGAEGLPAHVYRPTLPAVTPGVHAPPCNRPFLVKGTTAPTAADITFAALAALVVLPSNYGGASGGFNQSRAIALLLSPGLADTPTCLCHRAHCHTRTATNRPAGAWLPQPGQWEGYPDAELRGTPAGQHVIKMYELYRKPGGSSITTASTEVAPAADPQLAGCTALQ